MYSLYLYASYNDENMDGPKIQVAHDFVFLLFLTFFSCMFSQKSAESDL